MRQQAMSSRMLYGRPIPVARIMQGIADRELRQYSSLSGRICSEDVVPESKKLTKQARSPTRRCTVAGRTVWASWSLDKT